MSANSQVLYAEHGRVDYLIYLDRPDGPVEYAVKPTKEEALQRWAELRVECPERTFWVVERRTEIQESRLDKSGRVVRAVNVAEPTYVCKVYAELSMSVSVPAESSEAAVEVAGERVASALNQALPTLARYFYVQGITELEIVPESINSDPDTDVQTLKI